MIRDMPAAHELLIDTSLRTHGPRTAEATLLPGLGRGKDMHVSRR
jgi:hypothetical protein